MTLLVSLNEVMLHRLQQDVFSDVGNSWISSDFFSSIHHSYHGDLKARTLTSVGLMSPGF